MSPRRVSSYAATALVALIGMRGEVRGEQDPISAQLQAVFEKSKKAVVKVEAEDENGRLSGSGFFVDPNGTIYTCYSVGGESHDIVVSSGDMRYPARRLTADPRSGIAILKVEAQRTPFLPVGKSNGLGVASMVITIGYPLDLPITPNAGCVAGFDIGYNDRIFAVAHIRANVPVQRGEGGAPLLNMNGEAVGVLVSSLDGGSGCFALPIEAAEKVRHDFMRFGDVRPGWLGIKFSDMKKTEAGSRVKIDDFTDNGPAIRSSLSKGDVLLQIGDKKIGQPEDVLNAAFYLTAGDQVPVRVLRDGQEITVNLQPEDSPLAPEHTASLPPTAFGMPIGTDR